MSKQEDVRVRVKIDGDIREALENICGEEFTRVFEKTASDAAAVFVRGLIASLLESALAHRREGSDSDIVQGMIDRYRLVALAMTTSSESVTPHGAVSGREYDRRLS